MKSKIYNYIVLMKIYLILRTLRKEMKYHLKILVIMALLLSAPFGQAAETDKMALADALLKSPTLDFQQAQEALKLYGGILPGSPVSLSVLARTFITGSMASLKQRAGYYEKGLGYAEKLIAQAPSGVAGHYWKALNLSGLADVGTRMEGFKLLPKIMDAPEAGSGPG